MRTAWAKGNFAYAETMGSAFPTLPFKGMIHSVFPHALNVQDNADNAIYSLLTDHHAQYPRGVVVHAKNLETIDFTSLGFQAGQTVTSNTEGITFECGLWVSFLGAKRINPRYENPPKHMVKDLALIHLGCKFLYTLQEYAHTELRLAHLVPSYSTDSIFLQRFLKFAHELKNSFSENLLEKAIVSGKALIGFGPGLTPTGDDFLCGFALAAFLRSTLHPGSPDYVEEKFVHAWFALMLDRAVPSTPLTNLISLNFLTLAAAGKFSYSLIRLASVFETEFSTQPSILCEALESLSHYGHSSGLDAATGFFFGLSNEIPDTA